MATNTPLNPPVSLTTSVPATITAVKAIDAAVTQLEALPEFSSPVTPNLAAHIATAKLHGKQWQTTTRTSVVIALSDVASFSDTFDSEYDGLVTAAGQLGSGGDKAIADFKALLLKLQRRQAPT